MQPIDVQSVIDGTYQPTTPREYVQAAVIVQQASNEVDRGKANVYGYFLLAARIILGTWKERKESGGFNEPDVEFFEMASSEFKATMSGAIEAAGASGVVAKDLTLAKNAVTSLSKALMLGAKLLEIAPGGEYVLSGKSKIEQWNKATESKRAMAADAANTALASKHGFSSVDSEGNTAETGPVGNEDELLAGMSPDVRDVYREIGMYLVEMEKSNPPNLDSHAEALEWATKALGRLESRFEDAFMQFAAKVDAAANDEEHVEDEAADG